MKTHYDLIVAGGGFAGTGAAVAAARQGASVLLVEKNGYLSGSAGMSYVNPFMSQYKIPGIEGGERKHLVNAGIFEEIRQELKALGALHENERAFNMEILKIIMDRMTRSAGVDVLFHAYISDCTVEIDKIK